MTLPAFVRTFAPLLSVPVSLALHYTNIVAPVWVFLAGLVAIAVLADWVRRGTKQVAEHAGGVIGSLLNVSFGNAAELVLALFVLAQAQTQIVQVQITGSIIGTTLLFLGISALVGGVKHPRQTFSQERVGLLSTLLMLVAIAILLSALDERLSLAVSVVLLLLYAAHSCNYPAAPSAFSRSRTLARANFNSDPSLGDRSLAICTSSRSSW
jgi:Ca2+:H+ antiporter